MSKNTYIGVNDVAKKVKKIYIGVDGVAKKVKKAYVGVNGVAKLVYSAWNGELFSPEGGYDEITGGWKASSTPYGTYSGSDTDYSQVGGGVVPSLTYDENGAMQISVTGSHYNTGTVHTVNKIDLTDYKELTLNASLSGWFSGNWQRLHIVQDVSGIYNHTDMTNAAKIVNGTTTLNVSNVTGEWYVCISIYASGRDTAEGYYNETTTCDVQSLTMS